MTTNTILDIDTITNEALIVLKNSLGIGSRCLRKYDKSFGISGAKIGDTIRLRKPARFTVSSGPSVQAQNFVEEQVPLAIQAQRGVNVAFTTKDRALALGEYSDRILAPAMAQLAVEVDQGGLDATLGYTIASGSSAGAYGGVYNLATPGAIGATGPAAWTGAQVGSTATDSRTALLPFGNARARIKEGGAPSQDVFTVLSPGAEAYVVPALSGVFSPAAEISDQYKKGVMGTAIGAMWHESQNAPLFTAGNWVNSAGQQVNTTSTSGDTTLAVKGTASGCTFKQGDQFTVAGVYSVNPLTRRSTGQLQVFSVVSDVTATLTNATLTVVPKIINSGAYQTVSALPTANALVTMMGTASASTTVNLYYQKDAFALGIAPLEDVSAYGAQCYVASTDEEEGGISLRIVHQYNASDDNVYSRAEVLFGWALCRPELACRVQG